MSHTNDHDAAVAKLGALIKGIKVAMMTTIESDGTLRSRPMATQPTEFDGRLWFFTRADSSKVAEIGQCHEVNLSYADPSKERYVSVSGTSQLVRDEAKAKELWNPLYKAWFPKGLDDPESALLRIDVSKAEYWDAPSGKLVQLVGFLKAIATGKSYEPGEHEKVKLS